MMLANGHSMSKLTRRFVTLGPYIREEKCQDGNFFFDCLAECVNTKPAPEKREFWGWWLELTTTESGFNYVYHYGLFDKRGDWLEKEITESQLKVSLESKLQNFHSQLRRTLNELSLSLHPAEGFDGPALNSDK